ncbi:MAG: hypothetical protein EHM28_01390, partial [Spirochaetaceae bacterium]
MIKPFHIFILLFISLASTLQAQNKIADINELTILTDIFFLESSADADAGKLILLPREELEFKLYEGGKLPHLLQEHKRIYTLRTYFFIETENIPEVVCLYTGPFDYAADVYLNGIKIAQIGRSTTGYNSINYQATQIILPHDLLFFGRERNELALQLFPRYENETNPVKSLIITSFTNASGMVFFKDLLNIHFVRSAGVVSIILFIYFLTLFLTGGLREKKYMYFSLMCLFFFFGYFNLSYTFQAINEVFSEKISRIGLPLCSLFLALFVFSFCGVKKHRKILYLAVIIPNILGALILLFQSDKPGIQAVFSIVTLISIPASLIIAFIRLSMAVLKKEPKDAIYLLIALLLVFAASAHDIYYLTSAMEPFCWMVPYAYLVLVLATFFIMAFEQSIVYTMALKGSEDLNDRNLALRTILQKISGISNNLDNSSSILQKVVNSSVDVITSYERENTAANDKIHSRLIEIESVLTNASARLEASGIQIPRAIQTQAGLIEQFNQTIIRMTEQNKSITETTMISQKKAFSLAQIADANATSVEDSNESLRELTSYSEYINDIIEATEGITD